MRAPPVPRFLRERAESMRAPPRPSVWGPAQVLCWDVRATGDVVLRLPRAAQTNQVPRRPPEP